MTNRLDREYSAFTLFKFTVPSIMNLLFMSVYQMVDAIFISNCVGETALAAMNIIYPPISIILAVTLMFSTGGSAVVAGNMGRGDDEKAKENFTMIVVACVGLVVLLTILCVVFMDPLMELLGVTEILRKDSYEYLGFLILFMPIAAMQTMFQSFMIAAGKPGKGFLLTLMSGITNIVLDYLFVARLGWGMRGAATATAIGYFVGAVPGFCSFMWNRRSTLHFVKPKPRLRTLAFTCFNGSSEMVANMAISVTTILFNRLTLEYMGEDGVAAITVSLYSQFFMTATFMGYIGGSAPIFSFCFGSGDKRRLRSLFRHSFITVAIMSAVVMVGAYLLAKPIVSVFIKSESPVFALAYRGFLIFSTGYLFAGFNIYASGLFTALQNGKISAILSFLRTFVLLAGALLILPKLLDADGIWLAVPVAELLSCVVSLYYVVRCRDRYQFYLSRA